MTQLLGVIAALAAEARALRPLRQVSGGLHRRDDGTLVSISGMGADAATAGAQALACGGVTALMSFGTAGGLDPALQPGSIVVPERVLRRDGPAFATAQDWAGRLFSALSSHSTRSDRALVRGALLTMPRAVDEVAEKAALYQATGAVAVDMESAAIAAVAAERGLPFVAVRVIVDTAQDLLPKSVVAASTAGQVHMPTLLLGLIRSPTDVLPLLRLGRRFAAAHASMSAVAAIIGGGVP